MIFPQSFVKNTVETRYGTSLYKQPIKISCNRRHNPRSRLHCSRRRNQRNRQG